MRVLEDNSFEVCNDEFKEDQGGTSCRIAQFRGHNTNSFRKIFSYNSVWKGKFYRAKQVMAIVAEETDRLVTATVYAYFLESAK